MKYAADFRSIARESLRGKWLFAVAAGLVAVLLGGISSDGPEIKFHVDAAGASASLELAGQNIYSTNKGLGPELSTFLIGGAVYLILIAIVFAVAYFILGSIIGVGYARFNLRMVDQENPAFDVLFAYFPYWKTMAVARFLQSLYILLWSLLLIIPGIIATYSYAMTEFILAEQPELTASEAIARSKELMTGNRWRLFCLHFSFIGWHILCIFTFGIGNLWLNPYIQTATAAFYREISGSVLEIGYV